MIYAEKYYPSSKKCSTVNHDRDENAALNLHHYDEDNAKKIIKDVLLYHKNKVNHLPGKLKLNNTLLFNVNKTQA